MEKILTCKYKKCKKFYVQPVTLPCGNNICADHISSLSNGANQFYCVFCRFMHKIPNEGFALNVNLNQILQLNAHLNDEQKNIKKLIENLNNMTDDFLILNRVPDNFIFDYFSNLRNSILKEREKLKLRIDLISDEILDQIRNFERECKLNLKKLITTNDNQEKEIEKIKRNLEIWNEEIRKPEMCVDKNKLKEISDDLTLKINEIESKIIEYKNNLLVGKYCYFQPSEADFDAKIFGEFKLDVLDNIKFIETLRDTVLIKSNILSSAQSIDLINLCEFSSKDKFCLIYRATEDGFAAEDFHRKCDGIPRTLTIIKEKDSSYIFGGYTEASWETGKLFKKDKNAFIFSLTNSDNMPIKINVDESKNLNAILGISGYGPVFGSDLLIVSNSNKVKGCQSDLGNVYKHPDYSYGTVDAKKFLAGSIFFATSEIEVYRII